MSGIQWEQDSPAQLRIVTQNANGTLANHWVADVFKLKAIHREKN